MRIATWNCCGRFREKSQYISRFKPDVLAAQEVESLDDASHFCGECQPTCFYRAALRPIPKSIAALSYTDTQIDSLCVMPGVRCYAVRKGDLDFQVMAVWTSVSSDGREDYRQLHEALIHHDGFVRQRPTIVLGDLNLNATYKGDGWRTLQALTDSLGLVSAYHEYFKEAYGQETRPTYYHKHVKNHSFHVDYCFLPHDWKRHIDAVTIGTFEDWSQVSDHVPVIVDLSISAE